MLRGASSSLLVTSLLFSLACGCGGAVSQDGSSSGASSGASGSSSSSSGGSSGNCSAIGCVDGLLISFPLSTRWKPGTYVFSIRADGEEQICKGALPLPRCDSGRGLSCTGSIATIGESGCALPSSQQGFADIQFRSGPSKVTLRIERDGETIADETFTPAYRTSQPNGPNCGPVCRQASASVKLNER